MALFKSTPIRIKSPLSRNKKPNSEDIDNLLLSGERSDGSEGSRSDASRSYNSSSGSGKSNDNFVLGNDEEVSVTSAENSPDAPLPPPLPLPQQQQHQYQHQQQLQQQEPKSSFNEELVKFKPIDTLIRANQIRTYCHGAFQILGEGDVWIEVYAQLVGQQLTWQISRADVDVDIDDEYKFRTFDIMDAKYEVINNLLAFKDVTINFHKGDLVKWLSAIALSKFEYVKLNEAFTAVLLSARGSKLLDIHVLLSHKKRFPHFDWCNIRLPEVSPKWIKVYMVILPSDKHHLGRIEFYPSDKKMHKKYLIAYISDLAHIYNVFPEQLNLVELNSIMNALGNVHVSKKFEHVFPYSQTSNLNPQLQLQEPRKIIAKNQSISRSDSIKSLSSMASLNSISSSGSQTRSRSRSRSGSVNSTSSFFNQANPKTHARTRSDTTNSFDMSKNDSSFFKKHKDAFVPTSLIYIMPVPHPGVDAAETMIRNFIPAIDAFKLYGRPKHLLSEKANPDSMLFGYPSLPHYQYLSTTEAHNAFAQQYHIQMNQFQMEDIIQDRIMQLMNKKPYRGSGNVGKLFERQQQQQQQQQLQVQQQQQQQQQVGQLGYDSTMISPPMSPQFDDVSSVDDSVRFGSPRIASPLRV
ncbi:hypothetical protein LELG_01099 [Lodderomyces elongisporus NRRL YB-4239]|uniref:Skg3/CAF120-like PH-like domain-containing protein n=1 Tax=Lodderomyces elongisporus (strain ATCC 11503 / CBS 2605 / JCM 1781 / NBRC 1676 / NRRL YB-4239) TaxID=379508 RepID=A5DUR3_LODEL|nr:hypothetical protein LELG_01099 [Lodderomyces elongisporus NRRL YB-4239]